MSAIKLESLINNTINVLIQDMQPSGSVIVAIDKDIIYQQSFGIADIAHKIPMSMDTQSLAGSITKQFCAVAILKALLDKNIKNGINQSDAALLKLKIQADLNKPISSYLPSTHMIWDGSMPKWAQLITPHQLLIHSSGIPNYTNFVEEFRRLKMRAPDIPALISFFKDKELEFVPGTEFRYSNSGYILLGEIIHELVEQSLDDYMETMFFEPLQMHSTGLPIYGAVPDLKKNKTKFAKLALGYNFDTLIQQSAIYEVNRYEPMQLVGMAGGLISTAVDLLKWNNALYSGQIIPSFIVELLLQPYILTEQINDYYGYGIEIMKSVSLGEYYTHRGGITGYKSILTYIPKHKLSIICLSNVVVDMDKLMPELTKIKSELPVDLPEPEQWLQADKILEERNPNIILNKKKYDLNLISGELIKFLENIT